MVWVTEVGSVGVRSVPDGGAGCAERALEEVVPHQQPEVGSRLPLGGAG